MVTTTNNQRNYPQDPEFKATGLYVINISPNLLTKDLIQILSKYGAITNAAILGGLNFKHLYGYVDFAECGVAKYCMDALMSNSQDMSLLSVGNEKRYSTFLKFKWKKSEEHTDISRIINKDYSKKYNKNLNKTPSVKSFNNNQSSSSTTSSSTGITATTTTTTTATTTNNNSNSLLDNEDCIKKEITNLELDGMENAAEVKEINDTNNSSSSSSNPKDSSSCNLENATVSTESTTITNNNNNNDSVDATSSSTTAAAENDTKSNSSTNNIDSTITTNINNTNSNSGTDNVGINSESTVGTYDDSSYNKTNYHRNSNPRNNYYVGSSKGSSRKSSYSSFNGNDRNSYYNSSNTSNNSLKNSKSKTSLNGNATEYEHQSLQYQTPSNGGNTYIRGGNRVKKYNNKNSDSYVVQETSNKWSNDMTLDMDTSATITNTTTSVNNSSTTTNNSTANTTTTTTTTTTSSDSNAQNSSDTFDDSNDDILNNDEGLGGSKYWGDIVVEDEVQMKIQQNKGLNNPNSNYHYNNNSSNMRNYCMSNITPSHIPNYHVTPNYYNNSINAYSAPIPSGIINTNALMATTTNPNHMSYRRGSSNSINSITNSGGAVNSNTGMIHPNHSSNSSSISSSTSSLHSSINAVSYVPQQQQHHNNCYSSGGHTMGYSHSSSAHNNMNNSVSHASMANSNSSSTAYIPQSSNLAMGSYSNPVAPSSITGYSTTNTNISSTNPPIEVSSFPDYQWTKINVSRLQSNITSEHIQKLFSQFGVIKNVSLKEAKVGIVVFLEFEKSEDAENAVRELDDVHPDQKYPEFDIPPTTDTICVDFAYHRPAPSRCYRDSVIPVRIQGLSLDTKRGEIKVACVKYGDIARTRLLKCETAHGAKCSAMVEYVYRESANTALRELEGHLISLGYQGVKVEQWNYTIKGAANNAAAVVNNTLTMINPNYSYNANANYIYSTAGSTYSSGYTSAYTTPAASTYGGNNTDILGSGYSTLNNSPIQISQSNSSTPMPSSPSSTTTLNDNKEKQELNKGHSKNDNGNKKENAINKNKSKNSISNSKTQQQQQQSMNNDNQSFTKKSKSCEINKKSSNSLSSSTKNPKNKSEDSINPVITTSSVNAISVSE